jgi:hypothetical protein
MVFLRLKLCSLFCVILVFIAAWLCESFIRSNKTNPSFTIENSIFENYWIPEELKEAIESIPKDKWKLELEFETTVQVSAMSKYPCLYGDTPLIHFVNKALEVTARESFDNFIEQEKNTLEELDQDFGGCSLIYDLFPVYSLPNLISVYGYESQTRSCPHGWMQYIGKNFWQNEDTVVEISLKDLFIKGSDWCNFLLKYCDQYFGSIVDEYYQQNFISPLKVDDLDAFVLTEKGVMIVFQPYRVVGWADGPGVLITPYSDLRAYIDVDGPLKEILRL